MSYLQRSNEFSREKRRRRSIWLYVIFIIIIILGLMGPFSEIAKRAGLPFWKLSNSLSNVVADNVQVLKSKQALINDNEILKEKIIFYGKDIFFLDVLKRENEELKAVLGRKKKTERQVIASILVKPGYSPYDILIVDAGESEGVEVADKVLVDGNTFIGMVSEVSPNSSKVRLYSSPGEKVMVLIGPNNIQKEATGLGSGNFMLELPKEMTVSVGDNVVIPSITPNIFGTVERIEEKPSDSFQKIFFKSPINVQEMRYVEIITN